MQGVRTDTASKRGRERMHRKERISPPLTPAARPTLVGRCGAPGRSKQTSSRHGFRNTTTRGTSTPPQDDPNTRRVHPRPCRYLISSLLPSSVHVTTERIRQIGRHNEPSPQCIRHQSDQQRRKNKKNISAKNKKPTKVRHEAAPSYGCVWAQSRGGAKFTTKGMKTGTRRRRKTTRRNQTATDDLEHTTTHRTQGPHLTWITPPRTRPRYPPQTRLRPAAGPTRARVSMSVRR